MKPFLFSLASALVLLSTSCKKDPVSIITPPPAAPKVFSIKLNAGYLDGANVDSAFATWKINTAEQRVKFIVRNDSLITHMNDFTEGNGEMSVYIYSNKKLGNQYLSHWVLKKDITLRKSAAISYYGPNNFMDANWFPRAELKDGIGHKAIIGLRPDDSYFFIKNAHAQPGVMALMVDKSYWKTIGGIQGVGQGTWECTTGCTNANGDVENNSYFNFIPTQIGNKTWNHVEVIVFYQTEPQGGGWAISLNYDVPQQ